MQRERPFSSLQSTPNPLLSGSLSANGFLCCLPECSDSKYCLQEWIDEKNGFRYFLH